MERFAQRFYNIGGRNGVETVGEWAALDRSLRREAPYGSALWQQEAAQRLGLQSSLKPLGRPRKTNTAAQGSATLFDASSHHSDPQ